MTFTKIDVKDEAVLVLTHQKTQGLVKAVEEQQAALQGLAKSLQTYVDWLQEQLVRLDGEA